MRDRGLKEETRGVAEHPDEGWRYNPGREPLDSWRPDLGGYSAEARRMLEEGS